jgi:ABC-type Fe3+-hydroxamate transport system substrate-binding protein
MSKSAQVLGLALLALGAIGCGSSSGAPTPPSSAAAPVTVDAANGHVAIANTPKRIVSLSPSATEDIYAVGAGAQVVAVDSYSTYPARAPRTKLSGFKPNIEAIAAYRPDLVVSDSDSNKLVEQLGKLDVPVLIEPAPSDLDGAYAEIRQLGQATGHSAQATSVIAAMKRRIEKTLSSIQKPKPPITVYHELDPTFFSVTSHTFIGQLYKLLGLSNIADAAGKSGDYPQLSAEYVIKSRPQLIVLADTKCCGQSAATVSKRAGWQSIPAVAEHHIVAIDDSVASEWGPRVTLFFAKLAAVVRRLDAGA